MNYFHPGRRRPAAHCLLVHLTPLRCVALLVLEAAAREVDEGLHRGRHNNEDSRPRRWCAPLGVDRIRPWLQRHCGGQHLLCLSREAARAARAPVARTGEPPKFWRVVDWRREEVVAGPLCGRAAVGEAVVVVLRRHVAARVGAGGRA